MRIRRSGSSPRFPALSYSVRGCWAVLSGPFRWPAPKYPPPSRTVPVRPDPPRRCVDLQRLTSRRSRSFGFAAPPPSFLPCGLDPGVFRRNAPPVGFPSGAARRSWSCARPRGPLPLPGSGFRFGAERLPFPPSLLHAGFSPLRRSQPEESVSWSGLPSAACAAAFQPALAAGFRPRVVPPPPSLTTLAASSSSGPVACFGHTRPWGSFPSLPAGSVPTSSALRPPCRATGGGLPSSWFPGRPRTVRLPASFPRVSRPTEVNRCSRLRPPLPTRCRARGAARSFQPRSPLVAQRLAPPSAPSSALRADAFHPLPGRCAASLPAEAFRSARSPSGW
jgi:hypothetical protein